MDWIKILEKIGAVSRETKILPENEKMESLEQEESHLSQDNETDIPENVELGLTEREGLPEATEHTLLLCREQVEQKGEDFYLVQKDSSQLLMGVFDGCGGSGAKVYPQFASQTGARVASRTLAEAVKEWFSVIQVRKNPNEAAEETEVKPERTAEETTATMQEMEETPEQKLQKSMEQKLKECREAVQAGQLLLGSLKKEFPSTMVLFTVETEEQTTQADFFWCGDSRGYVLDMAGLHQVTKDDVAITDAMENLREDAPMTNVANASVPFVVHRKSIELKKPSLLIAATDGCFGYLPSPMEFEKLLLQTMNVSENMEQWKSELEKEIEKVAGDDFTLAIWNGMFGSFQEMKDSFRQRQQYMEEKYPLEEKTTEEMLSIQWREYKTSYESLMDAGEVKHGN